MDKTLRERAVDRWNSFTEKDKLFYANMAVLKLGAIKVTERICIDLVVYDMYLEHMGKSLKALQD